MLFLAVGVYGGVYAWEMGKRRGQRVGADHGKGQMTETMWPNGLVNKSVVKKKKIKRLPRCIGWAWA